jgi:hypothetical protein
MSTTPYYPNGFNRGAMDPAVGAAARPEVASWRSRPPAVRAPPSAQWHLVSPQDRLSVAGVAPRVWQVADRLGVF